jgi:hypothetical protein
MTGQQVLEMVQSGLHPVIRITDDRDIESMDEGMMAVIKSAIITPDDPESVRLVFDLNDFEVHNRSVAKATWFDADHNPTLTWFESNFYPEDGLDTLWVDLISDVPFEIVNEKVQRYLASGSTLSYVEWLEQQIS